MNTSHLCKHILSHYRLVGSYRDATKTLNHTRDVVQLTLYNIRFRVELVLQDSLNRGQRSITTTLSQSVDGDVQSSGTTEHSGQ